MDAKVKRGVLVGLALVALSSVWVSWPALADQPGYYRGVAEECCKTEDSRRSMETEF